jgi:peptide deformylase
MHQLCGMNKCDENCKEQLITDMFSLAETLNGVGLAGPQVSIEEKIAVILWQNQEIVLINPRIKKSGPIITDYEGCLSLPDTIVYVPRYETVRVESDGAYFGKFRGWLARVIQHEVDHLKGKLITDYLHIGHIH